MLNRKVTIIYLIVGLIKKTLYKMSQYVPKPFEPFGGDINFKVDLSNYTTKTDLKKATGVVTSKLAAKSDLTILKAEIDKNDLDKLQTVPVDLSKLSNVLNNEVVKKTLYDKSVAKGNDIDTSGFVLKAKYDTQESVIVMQTKMMPNTSGLAKNTDYKANITEIENKIFLLLLH